MRIAINCRSFLTTQYTGIGRYAYNLVNSLTNVDTENEYVLYVRKGLIDKKRKAPSIKAPNFSTKVDFFNRGIEHTTGPIDIYHSPSMDFVDGISAKVVVTVHDLVYKTYPAGHTQQTIDLTRQHFESFIPKASKIICCSHNTQRDLHRFFDIDEKKSCVIHQGVDKNSFYPIDDDEKARAEEFLTSKGIVKAFILFVGTIEPRKNLKNLLKAFALLKQKNQFDGQLVIAGMVGWKSEGISALVTELKIKNDVCFLGFIDNDQLRYCYNETEVFVFPSLYEGFGYPIVEAFCCGAPVVVSNVATCTEVAADAALNVDPNDPMLMAEEINKVLQEKNLRDELRKKGLKRAEDFDFEKTARQTLEVYREVYST